jgi:pimeloyl-ACP methyl ester carboxylesterase
LRRVARRQAPGEPHGEVAVTRLDGPDGVDRYVVELPGTDSWPLRPGDDVRDLAGNVQLSTGTASTYTAGVAAVLAAAGVPRGAQVLLVGHSQGGMAAYAVAASPAIGRRYAVAGVLTAGSPLGRMHAPAGVRVLSLENADDVVPSLDGRWPVDVPSVTTARFRRQTGTVEGNHALDGYAAAGDELPDVPSVAAWRGAVAGFLAGGTVVSTRRSVITRSRPGSRKPP